MSHSLIDNNTRLQALLPTVAEISHLINGKPRAGAETFESRSPVDNALIATVAKGDAGAIDEAAKAADIAFKTWASTPPEKRQKLLHKLADLIEKRADDIAVLESYDTGQPIRFMAKAAVRGAENFRFFADKATEAKNGLNLPTPTHWNMTSRQPIGAVGVITPWNTPFMLSTWKIAPALAAGCTVVHKPAEWSPVTASLLSQLALEAGIPEGVLNTVHGFGESAGKALTQHPRIKAIGFVGETATGSAIMRQGSETLKRVHFELGGKNPVIVFEDADIERALDAVIFMIYSLNGERCTSSSRLLLHESLEQEFTQKLLARIAQIKVGNPLDPLSEIGPLIHARQFNKVCSYLELAKAENALLTGHKGEGLYVHPTLVKALPQSRLAKEEVFGPFLTLLTFKTQAEAIALANDVAYGLAAYVWTQNLSRALAVSEAIEAGMIWVNSENVRHLATPFGGMKMSGLGRDGGDYSFDFYMETKNISLALGTHAIPKLGV